MVENSYFSWITLQLQKFLVNICENMFKHDVKAVYHETFLGSEGKDVNQVNQTVIEENSYTWE